MRLRQSLDYEIDFTKTLISRGTLPNAIGPAATVTGIAFVSADGAEACNSFYTGELTVSLFEI